jgi:predicted branched-subunit amino acid permease
VWNLTTLVGALGASRLGDPDTYGLDVVGPAAFFALLWPRLRQGAPERRVAVLAAIVAVGATPLLPPGIPVMLAAVAALAGTVGRRTRPRDPGEPPAEPALTAPQDHA